ncbi:hypothetical protein PCCS19_59220 [Paenibacillus sp. CCS19]|uniref:hypothetical protein n=1 Tax=Paenibacillus sp. CCS19 TaxID=3158387 RepID=UPI002564E48E|nr:hypothetical protein [Paenibacillus cellulosilyticus]GMK42861.1 hypothetical protein PCCS19_59220 [Paenibacillus cellulosilyticus]
MNRNTMIVIGFILIVGNLVQVVSRWGDNDSKFYLYLGLLLLVAMVMVIRVARWRGRNTEEK